MTLTLQRRRSSVIGAVYFESDPWDKAIELVSAENLGEIVEIQVQAVCRPGSLETVVSRWTSRIETVVGPLASRDVLHKPGVYSAIGKTARAIVRIFIDESGDAETDNFELALTEGLLIWNHAVHPLSLIYEGGQAGVILSDAGPAALGECAQ